MGIITFIKESMRVMNVATRPKQKEFERIVTVTGIGTIIVGLMGVLIMIVLNLITR
jgi:protein translocase SEC61 complex gamma subunit